jgi:hypothetical protein
MRGPAANYRDFEQIYNRGRCSHGADWTDSMLPDDAEQQGLVRMGPQHMLAPVIILALFVVLALAVSDGGKKRRHGSMVPRASQLLATFGLSRRSNPDAPSGRNSGHDKPVREPSRLKKGSRDGFGSSVLKWSSAVAAGEAALGRSCRRTRSDRASSASQSGRAEPNEDAGRHRHAASVTV